MSKLVIGCGYLGHRVASLWRNAGESVFAVTRSASRAEVWHSEGLQPIIADVTDRASLANLPSVDTVLYAVGRDRGASHSMRDVYVDGLSALLDALPSGVGRLIYISSTSVYGQQDGSWIDEDSPCEPVTESGRICLEAEQLLECHRLGARACILRLAGIYGPDRIPRREALARPEPLAVSSDAYLNLIHVDDAVTVIDAVARHAAPATRYLVADGHPVIRADFYAHLAALCGLSAPRFTAPADEGRASARGATNKRASNRRLLAQLKPNLNYPTYREGLAAVLAAEQSDGATGR
jgi:nucleoside-diphosphate-sugar epimerase